MQRLTAGFSFSLFLIIAGIVVPSSIQAKSMAKAKIAPEDRIDILANLAIAGGPITRVTMTQHYSRSYLYLEHASHTLTLVDVTDAHHPSIIASMDLPANESGSIMTAAGDTALVSSDASPAGSAPASSAPANPDAAHGRTMSIVSFADPAHPQTVKQFNNVTCTALDDRRGLVFVANSEGLWILHRNPAEDPEVQERYAHEVLYNH